MKRPAVLLCDLDGVVWLDHVPVPGAAEAIARVRAAGTRVVFVTNNSSKTLAEQADALAAIGIPAEGDVVSSSTAAAALVAAGDRVMVCGGAGIVEAVTGAGAVALPRGDDGELTADAVMVGFHRDFDYERLRRAAAAITNGATFVGTNDDATFPTADGPIPGGGAILAAVATGAQATPIVAGKPNPAMADAVTAFVAPVGLDDIVMVGDRIDTDGRFAATLGVPFALVRTGVTRPGQPTTGPVALDVDDLAAVVAAFAD